MNFQSILPLNQGIKGKVAYKAAVELPKSKVLNHENKPVLIKYVFDLILTLPDTFLEEQEYRLQRTFFNGEERTFNLNKENVEKVILGYRMSKSKRIKIINLIKDNLPNTNIIRLKYNHGSIIEINE